MIRKKNNPQKSDTRELVNQDGKVNEFSEEYYEVLDEINENNDEDAKDNNSDYMDELREESETIE